MTCACVSVCVCVFALDSDLNDRCVVNESDDVCRFLFSGFDCLDDRLFLRLELLYVCVELLITLCDL